MKKLIQKRFLWLVPLALVATGCNRQTALVPPQIHYGLETCADCKMIINDAHYAAAIAWQAAPDSPAQISSFDDIGCLLSWRQHHAGTQVVAIWVKDVNTAKWLDASAAVYLKSDRFSTPMGSGIVAGTASSDFAMLPVHDPVLNWPRLLQAGEPKAGPLAEAKFDSINH
jgi:copper chaperone NosL